MKKPAQWFLLALATIVAIAVASHSVLSWMTGRGRKASVDRLKDRLALMRPEPAAPAAAPVPGRPTASTPAAPDDELIASWQRLFAIWEAKQRDNAFAETWERVSRVPLLVRWGDTPYNELGEEELELLAGFLGENADILEGIHALTQPDMPACDFGAYNDINLHWQFDQLLSANMLRNTAQGNFEDVARDLIALLKMCDADAYVDYPFAMGHGTEQCLRDAIVSGTVSDDVWQALLNQLEASRDHRIFVDDWARTAGHWLDWYEDLPGSGSDITNPPVLGEVLGWGYRYAGTPLLNHNLGTFSDVMEQLLDVAPLPYYRARPTIKQIRDEYDIPVPWELPLWQSEPGMWNISTLIHERFSGRGYVEAHIDMARMAILLERHRTQFGAYPESLEAVAAGFGGTLPPNPLTGKPFEYERGEETFRLGYRSSYQDEDGTEHASRSMPVMRCMVLLIIEMTASIASIPVTTFMCLSALPPPGITPMRRILLSMQSTPGPEAKGPIKAPMPLAICTICFRQMPMPIPVAAVSRSVIL